MSGNMAKEERKLLRTPEMVRTAHGHVANKWCGSCAYKEMKDGGRTCSKLSEQVEIDDICREWELDERIARL